MRLPPRSSLFPYTTLFRSSRWAAPFSVEGSGRATPSRPPREVVWIHPDSIRREEDPAAADRSEEHTSELQSRLHLVCRRLLETKNSIKLIKASAVLD